VLPVARGYPQPLAAAYRVTLTPLLAELLAAGELRLTLLFRRCATLRVDDAALLADPALATADPALESVVNVNTPDEYQAARQRLAPQVTVQTVTTNSRSGPRAVRAATLFGAAAAVGLSMPSRLVTTLNSSAIDSDGDVQLVTGDTIVFSCLDAGG
jgi:molybdenum cofactor guanylyltransferase